MRDAVNAAVRDRDAFRYYPTLCKPITYSRCGIEKHCLPSPKVLFAMEPRRRVYFRAAELLFPTGAAITTIRGKPRGSNVRVVPAISESRKLFISAEMRPQSLTLLRFSPFLVPLEFKFPCHVRRFPSVPTGCASTRPLRFSLETSTGDAK